MTLLMAGPLAIGAAVAAATLLAAPMADSNQALADLPEPHAAPREGQWPITPPQVLTDFEDPLPYAAGHRGLDLEASVGQTVQAALPGVVTFAGMVAGRPLVVVEHVDGVRTTYLPALPLVSPGARVRAGSPIGRVVASAHCLSVTCLHWGARDSEGYIDPSSLLPLSSGPIVLLPLPLDD